MAKTQFNITAVATMVYVFRTATLAEPQGQGREFGAFESLVDLKTYYDSFKVEPYTEFCTDPFSKDGPRNYTKHFAKDSPLEYSVPLTESDWEKPNTHGHGIYEHIHALDDIVKGERIGFVDDKGRTFEIDIDLTGETQPSAKEVETPHAARGETTSIQHLDDLAYHKVEGEQA